MINLVIKDVKNIIYDRKVLMVLLGMPIILMTILGNALQGTFSDQSGVFNIDIAIVKAYDYEAEEAKVYYRINHFFESDNQVDIDLLSVDPEVIFFEDFLGDGALEFLNYKIVTLEEAKKAIDRNEISAYIVLPENFIYDSIASMTFSMRNKLSIEVVKNTEKSFSAGIVEGIIEGYIEIINGIVIKKNVIVSLSNNGKIESLDFGELMNDYTENIGGGDITEKDLSGREPLNSFQYYTVGIMTMFLLYAAAQGGKSLLEERRDFTAQRLEVSGIGIERAATSNMIRIIIITFFQTIITIIYSSLVLGVDWGDPLTVLVGMIFTGFAIGGMGMFVSVIAYISDKAPVANIFEMVVVQFFALVGGSFIPVQIFPKFIQKLQIFTPNGSALHIYLNGMYYKPLSESYIYILALFIVGALFMGISYVVLYFSKGRIGA